MKQGMILAGIAVLLAGCNSDADRIEELEQKVESMESQRASLAGSPTSAPSPSASASAASGSASSAQRPSASTAANDEGDENVCNDGKDRYLTLVNNGEETIMYFYASPPDAGDWEEDVLGDDVVSTGDRFRINFNSDSRCTCTYDTRAMFADDSEVIRKVSVCTDHTQNYP